MDCDRTLRNSSNKNRGAANSGLLIVFGSLIVVGVLVLLLFWDQGSNPSVISGKGILLYCAAGIQPPVEAAVKKYEEEYGVSVQVQYGGSGQLLSNIQVASRGDLYLAADNSYIEDAKKINLVRESIPLAHLRPVIAFQAGNPRSIQSLDDLLQKDLRIALANPEAAAIGRSVRKILKKSGKWTILEERTKVFKPTVNDVANDIKLGTVDVGIIWDATANQYPEIDMIDVPIFEEEKRLITIGVLSSCEHSAAALHFARYLGARDRGLLEFKRLSYEPVEGDEWANPPELLFFSGGVNRLAVEETLREFEEREGVSIFRKYNGCGILVGQMKTGERPDAYFACDVSFMKSVGDLFEDSTDISETAMVIVVQKNNPLGIKNIKDLARKGLKLGVANAEQSALGGLTEKLLKGMGLYTDIMKNVVSQTPTADLLVAQISTNSLDVVIVYEANTTKVRDKLDIVPIDETAASAIQPFALGVNSRYKYLTSRLLDALKSVESRSRFEKNGFRWKLREQIHE